MSKIIKKSYIAYNWDDYVLQGPNYQKIKDWWELNSSKLPGGFNSSYESWTKWYKNKYHGAWNKTHVNPVDVLPILEYEMKNGDFEVKEVKEKNNIFRNRKPEDNLQNQSIGGNVNYKLLIRSNQSANVEQTTDAVKQFLASLGSLAKKKNMPKPFVTSAFRTSNSQIRAMSNNWKKYGGADIVSDADAVKLLKFHKDPAYINEIRKYTNKPLNKGLVYLFDLYGDKEMVLGLNEIFLDIGTGREGVKTGTEFWDSLEREKKSHLASPATAVDLRISNGHQSIPNLVKEIEAGGLFNMKVLHEGDHLHVDVRGINK